jgi:uncharacterized protein YqjF (DUF2071 family)
MHRLHGDDRGVRMGEGGVAVVHENSSSGIELSHVLARTVYCLAKFAENAVCQAVLVAPFAAARRPRARLIRQGCLDRTDTVEHTSSSSEAPTTAPTAVSIDPTERVRRPVMLQEWRDVAFVHWSVDPESAQRLLPDGLTVDTINGSGWVGLVGFSMVGIRPPGLPRVPYLGSFPETNVRTYVRDARGRPGVWFHSLEASRLLPVMTARVGYSLPYMWAKMALQKRRSSIHYSSRRRWPGPSGAGGTIVIEPESVPVAPDPLSTFLTARWSLYSQDRRGRLRYAPVEHPPWKLHTANVAALTDTLVTAVGYSAPIGEPHVLWSPGVSVRVGLPRRVR